jgi:uncharacterized integral membrane protein
MILITAIFTLMITGTVIWMLHGIGRILMLQDKKDSNEVEDDDLSPPQTR